MQNNRIKYQVVCCVEREMSIIGIFPSMEEAKNAVLNDMANVLECSVAAIKAADGGEDVDIPCEELGIGESSAWANNVGLSHANYDWKIFQLTCDGECQETVPGDKDVINTTYRTYWSSGAYFDAPCKVNTKTHEVFDISTTGCASDDDDCYEEDVVIRDDNGYNEYVVVSLDAVLDECTIEEALESLQNIKRNGGYWRGDTSLDESIKQLELEL